MLINLHRILALVGAALTVYFGGMLYWWGIPVFLLLFIAYTLGLFFLHILVAFIWSLFLKPDCKIEKVHPIYRFMVEETVRLLLFFGRVHVKFEGAELLPEDKNEHFLLVSNHRSRFDPMISLLYLRKWPTAFISKPENFKIPIAGRFIHMCHYLAINRDDPRAAMQTIREATGILTSGEQNVGVYPEGTRSTDGTLLPFHDGVFLIAAKAKCAVAVMTVENTDLIAKHFPLHATHVTIRIHRYFKAEELSGKRSGEISALVRAVMEKELAKETGSASGNASFSDA